MTEALVKIDAFVCSDTIVQNFINVISNNPTVLQQFTTIVNQSVECDTIWNCGVLTTTTTTTLCSNCDNWIWENIAPNASNLVYKDCNGDMAIIDKHRKRSGTMYTTHVGSTYNYIR